jgi:hypothetical protein
MSLTVGMTIDDAQKLASAGIIIHNNEDPRGDCVFGEIAGWSKTPFSFMLIKGTIARFDVYEGEMKTWEGIGIGSSEDEIKRLYAHAKIEVTPHAYVDGHYLEITMPGLGPNYANYRYIFETDGKKVTAFRAGRLPEVGFIEGCA